jgi:hypothetical protein
LGKVQLRVWEQGFAFPLEAAYVIPVQMGKQHRVNFVGTYPQAFQVFKKSGPKAGVHKNIPARHAYQEGVYLGLKGGSQIALNGIRANADQDGIPSGPPVFHESMHVKPPKTIAENAVVRAKRINRHQTH